MASTVGVAVLFTDLVGSTALASELGPAEAERMRVTHFGLLREVVEDQGGREVKNLGDGIMAVFPGASVALDAAVAMQRAFHRHNATQGAVPMTIRTGVATGDCTEEDGDYFGEPVVQAARLSAKADGGEILAHAVFRMLVPHDAHDLVDVGELELKGLPDPVPTIRVAWTPEDDVTAIPLPTRLTVHHATPLVGRSHEQEVLRDGLKAAANGERTVLLVTGEAGLGKTRLTSSFAMEAAESGALVLYGRCDEELAVPYLPWIESLGHWAEHADDSAIDAIDAQTVTVLARLLPALQARMPGAAGGTGGTGDQYALVAAVSRLLSAMAARRTTVVILDDLHWADAASLLLLRQVASSLVDARLLLIGTYRETDLGPDDPLAEVSASLHRVEGVHRLALGGLSDIEVVHLMEAIAGHELDDEGVSLAHSMRADAAGNPFFVVELLRHLAEAGEIVQGENGRWTIAGGLDSIALPQSVRDVVGQRVRRLGGETHTVLTAAAVVGREFDADVVAGATDRDEDEVLDRLEESMTAGLIAEVPARAGRFTFTHALVQHTLYGDLSAGRRARMHRAVAEAIESIVGDRPGSRVGELANHWFAAVRPSELDRAIAYAIKAGERALDASAPDEAVRWFTQVVDSVGEDDPELRCEALARLGDAERRAGRDTYRDRLLVAAALAQRCGRDDIVVQAAIDNHRGIYGMLGEVDEARVAVLESALDRIEPGDDATRARLLATLAGELTYGNDLRRFELAQQAVDAAERTSDDDVVTDTMERIGSALNVPESLRERDQQTRRAIELTASGADPVRRFFALDRRIQVLLELADRPGARRCAEEREAIADQLGEPTLRWFAALGTAALDLIEGDLAAARRGAEASLALGFETGQPDALVFFGAQMIQIHWHLGQYDECIPYVEQGIERAPGVSTFPPVLATFLGHLGRTDEARTVIEGLAATGFETPHDLLWLTTAVCTAEAIHLVDDRDSAAVLFERLLPFRDHVAVSRSTFQGAVSYYLGLLAITLGRPEADELLVDAAERNGRLRAPFHRSQTLLALAGIRRERDPAGAQALVAEVAELVERYDIGALRAAVGAFGG